MIRIIKKYFKIHKFLFLLISILLMLLGLLSYQRYKTTAYNNLKITARTKVKNPYKYKVVLDPGHGGRDPGNINGNLIEKDFTLKICYYIYKDLIFNGCQVILTRETDIEFDKLIKKDLIKRATTANDIKADIFVSIHLNAGDAKDKNFKKYKGIATYYQNNKELNLAQAIQKHAVESDDWENRKTLPANYSVLRNTVMPSALVECGFMTNSDDVIRLKNETILNNLGTNIGEGIMEYINYKNSCVDR